MVRSKYSINKKSNVAGVSNNVTKLEGFRLSSEGVAVGYHEGKGTFVPGLLPGETGQV